MVNFHGKGPVTFMGGGEFSRELSPIIKWRAFQRNSRHIMEVVGFLVKLPPIIKRRTFRDFPAITRGGEGF